MTKNVTELYVDDFKEFEKELQKNMFEGINKIFDYGVLKGIKSCNLEEKNNISAVELEEIYDSLQKIKSVHIAISQSLYGGEGISEVPQTNIKSLYYSFVLVEDMLAGIAEKIDSYI